MLHFNFSHLNIFRARANLQHVCFLANALKFLYIPSANVTISVSI